MVRLFSFLNTIYRNRYLIRSYAVSDLRKRYTGSMMGLLWSFIHPLMLIFTYYFIFSYVFSRKVTADYGTNSYALWLMCGIVPWMYFSETIRRSAQAVLDNRTLITKTLFPSEILPITLIASSIVNHAVGLLIILVVDVAVMGRLTPFILFLPVYFFLMSVLILGIGWILSSLNVFVRDVGQAVTIVVNLWFYYTPIFYPVGIVPDKYRFIMELNPVYHIVEGYRDSLITAKYPEPSHLLYLAAFSGLAFAVGGLMFKRLKPAFADVL